MTAKAFQLNGKAALVAGENTLWNPPVAEALAAAGADVALAAKDSPSFQEAIETVNRKGKKVLALPLDVTRPVQVKGAVRQVLKEFGKIDILVHTGDILFFKPFLKIKERELKKVLDYHVSSAWHFCRAVIPAMLKQKKGRIIHVVSGLGERGMVNGSAYCLAMGGVMQLTRALALEYAGKGVTVNAVGTGWFTGPGRPVDEALARYIPVKRFGRPEEIASLVVYLASDVTDFTTGQVMFVDGGVMAHA
jgi:NAD(P)-dependent dehydrogenase (short-subunit alcohol dehydrogenase family)